MPLYDYRCNACGRSFELLVRSGSEPACPHCNGGQLEKLVSLPTAPGRSAAIIAGARRQAAKEGHFSHYAPSERPRLKS